jgi:hypothetical protein
MIELRAVCHPHAPVAIVVEVFFDLVQVMSGWEIFSVLFGHFSASFFVRA